MMMKVFGIVVMTVLVAGIEPVPDKDIFIGESNRFGKKMEMLDDFDDHHFRYDAMRKPSKVTPRGQSRRGDNYYVVPSNQQQKLRQPKRSHNDYLMEIMKDYPGPEPTSQHVDHLGDMGFPPKPKKPEFDYFPSKFSQDEPKYPPFEPDDHKFGTKFQPDDQKYTTRFEPEEQKYHSRFEPEDHKYNTRFEPDDHKFASKFEPEDHKFASKFEPDDHKFASKFEPEDHKFASKFEPDDYKFTSKYEPEDHKYLSKFEPEDLPKYGSKFEPLGDIKYSKNVYGNEEPSEEGKHKDDLGRYEHYEPYVPKRRQPVRPTFQRSFTRDEPRSRHQDRPQDFGYYTQESSEGQKPKRRPPPPPCLPEEEFESCDCE